jgi:hypothetical protein
LIRDHAALTRPTTQVALDHAPTALRRPAEERLRVFLLHARAQPAACPCAVGQDQQAAIDPPEQGAGQACRFARAARRRGASDPGQVEVDRVPDPATVE